MKKYDHSLAWIALMLFVVLMGYTVSVANAGEEYHAKIKPIKQQYCFTKIIITTKGDTITKEEKLTYGSLRKKILYFSGQWIGINPLIATKSLNSHSAALGFQAISIFLLSSAKFVVTNKVIFVRNLSAKY